MSVNMLSERFTIDCQPRRKNGQPHQNTTGVLKMNCAQRERSSCTQCGAEGSMCHIARMNTGTLRAAPIHNLRDMSFSSAFSSSLPGTSVVGSSVIPQMGQLPG